MATPVSKEFQRIEIWLSKHDATYASHVARLHKSERKLYLEKIIKNVLSRKRESKTKPAKSTKPLTKFKALQQQKKVSSKFKIKDIK